MSSLFAPLSRVYKGFIAPPVVPKNQDVVQFGILGAANIAPSALILPCRSHPSAVVYAIAARDLTKAETYAKRWGIPKCYGSYQRLLNDANVDAVYIALPNGLHYEWALRALMAGKHVLLEKPSTNTAAETRALFELAEEKGLVLLEAFHYRFHPAAARVKDILGSGELGAIQHIEAAFCTPKMPYFDDIRYHYELGGGALMDLGCYCIDSIRYFTSLNPTGVLSVHHIPHSHHVDRKTMASLSLPHSITASLVCDMSQPLMLGVIPPLPRLSVTIHCQGGVVQYFNFIFPTLYHSITVRPRDKGTRVEHVYGDQVGEDWWTTYRFQLEAFVDRVQKKDVRVWIEGSDSVENMKWIEEIYQMGGMGSRPASHTMGAI